MRLFRQLNIISFHTTTEHIQHRSKSLFFKKKKKNASRSTGRQNTVKCSYYSIKKTPQNCVEESQLYTFLKLFLKGTIPQETYFCPIHKRLYLLSWCFKPSQPQRITSGLNTNFTLSPSQSFHKSSYHKVMVFFLAYLYSAGTQHGNLHPAG